MEPFKNFIDAALVRDVARRLSAAWPRFDAARFERLARDGLDALELKARAMQLAAALEATLPRRFDRAAAVLHGAIDAGLEGWALWPVGEVVARRGLHDPERALELLRALTPRFTAEWAIRPFIVAHPALTFATLARWARDPDEHVRRLVSEGSRPRLPWGLQLKQLIADPSPALPLLEALQDDPSAFVRRSVANHLNDIAKDHPALVADWIERHLPGAPPERRALLRHACRTLIKRGDERILHAWGHGAPFAGTASLRVEPRHLRMPGVLTIEAALTPRGRRAQSLVVDYAVHHVKAGGGVAPKVFKGWTFELAAGEKRVLTKRHAIRPITTRRYFAGTHAVELLVNGRAVARAAFVLAV